MKKSSYVIFHIKLDEIVNLNDEEILNSEVERIMSRWVIEFLHKFSEWFENLDNLNEYPRFLELRPHDYLL
jgi:hypothetical protein